ncbi:hypothetical protein HY496_03495 [Candidatus Woesearchaeota archaeon]|nr:hypothetical protein [Candidatus Woesearchaeota archaeon]
MQPFSREEHKRILHPLIAQLEKLYTPGKTIIVGIQGGQGTGKTTFTKVLQKELELKGYHVTSFSLDDFYLPLSKREALQKRYSQNPFYQIPRGLPGTHRLSLLKTVLYELRQGRRTEIPLFDKSIANGRGDVSPLKAAVHQRQDFILFEGWCVGIPFVTPLALARVCSKHTISLKDIDPKLEYSRQVLRFVRKYRPLWKFVDYSIMLRPRHPSLHLKWRMQQERELKQARGEGMSEKEVERFVNLFLPFTYLCYEKIKPDATIMIDKEHTFTKVVWKK